MQIDKQLRESIRANVRAAIAEDVGGGDLTAALLGTDITASASVTSRERAVISGLPWFDEVFRQIDDSVVVQWSVDDGEAVEPGATLCALAGPARSLLSGERTALNFLQMMSATATATRQYVDAVAGTGAVILDTRKTLPGLRLAQKYAVLCGGGQNHRIGLFDAVLIKENHIAAGGGIDAILRRARSGNPDVLVEIEVESLRDLRIALGAGAQRIMLDNFSLADTVEAVRVNREEFGGRSELESSGGKTLEDVRQIAATGVDYISVGALTKNIRAVDLSMLIET